MMGRWQGGLMKVDCDILIIGSGAAGGVLAATLAEHTDKRIVVVERGGYFGRESFDQTELGARHLFAGMGLQGTRDGSIAVRGGACVGGGTTVNVALCFDPKEPVWSGWRSRLGVKGFSFDADASDYGIDGLNMANSLKYVRERIHVHTPPDKEVNDNNRLLQRGCEALGFSHSRFELNMRDCIGCGFCAVGCAYDRKQGTMVTCLRDAIDRGVWMIHSCRVDALRWEGEGDARRVVGASGVVLPDPPRSRRNSLAPGEVEFNAGLVIVAAGAIESPALLMRSEHPDPHDLLGRGLVLHPSLPLFGVHESPLKNYRGITGTIYSDHFYESDGFYLECLYGHPIYAAGLVSGLGVEHFRMMREFTKTSGFGVMLVDTPSRQNRVALNRQSGKTEIHYQLSTKDQARLRYAAQKAVEVMFAGGAREAVLPSEQPLGELPRPHFTRPEQASLCQQLSFDPHRIKITSAHPQATVGLGEDPRTSMINSRGESHGIRNLVVCDSSAFPTSCGANPMVSIMTMARYQGMRIARELQRYDL
jgi:choline dehydrogenase-like flavoprotein